MTIKAKYDAERNKVFTGLFRLSFPHIFDTMKDEDGSDTGKYSIQMLIPKTDKETINALQDALQDAIQKEHGANPPKGLVTPIKDGDDIAEEKERNETVGMWVVNATTKNAPGIVDKFRKRILAKKDRERLEEKAEIDANAAKMLDEVSEQTADDVYGGCWCRATINTYPWKYKSRKGVSFGLGNVQKIKDDNSFSGRSNPTNDFDDFEDVDDDMGTVDEDAQRRALLGQ